MAFSLTTLNFLVREKFTYVISEAPRVLLITAFSNLSYSVLLILCDEKSSYIILS